MATIMLLMVNVCEAVEGEAVDEDSWGCEAVDGDRTVWEAINGDSGETHADVV